MTSLLVPAADGTTIDPAQLPRLLAGPIAVTVVSIVAGWFLLANAVAGIRGREVTLLVVRRDHDRDRAGAGHRPSLPTTLRAVRPRCVVQMAE